MSELFLGRVEYAHGDWARLEPVAALAGGRWQDITDRVSEFPDEGLVFAPPSVRLGRATHGSYWTFTRRVNERAASGKDRFVIAEATAAVPLVDLSDRSIEEARQMLFDEGVSWPNVDTAQAVVLLRQGLHCVLAFGAYIDGRRRATVASTPVALMAAQPSWMPSSGTGRAHPFLPQASIPTLPVVRHVNWCSDADFVERVLLRMRKHAVRMVDTGLAGPGREAIQRVARALEQSDLLPGGQDDVEMNLERLQVQWPKLEARLKAADEMRELVLESDVAIELIQEAVEKAREAETARLREALEKEVRAELADALSQIRQELDAAQSELETTKASLILERGRLDTASREREEMAANAAAIEGSVRSYLTSLRASLERISPEEAALARMFADRLSSVIDGHAVSLLPPASPPWATPAAPLSVEHIDMSGLGKHLESQSKAHSVDSVDVVDALARAGELVLLTGPHAERCLSAYARSITGGVVKSMALDPSIIGLDDLWVTPGGRLPTSFARAWNQAQSDAEQTVLVCLRNLDASPMHLWLPALSAVLRSAVRPRNLLVLATSLGLSGKERYPHAESLIRWLAPVQPGQGKSGGFHVLASLSSQRPKATTLRWDEPNASEAVKSDEFVQLVLDEDAETVARAASLAAAIYRGPTVEDNLLEHWVRLISGKGSDGCAPYLKSGVEALSTLNYQH